jgi:hypothetical protein
MAKGGFGAEEPQEYQNDVAVPLARRAEPIQALLGLHLLSLSGASGEALARIGQAQHDVL